MDPVSSELAGAPTCPLFGLQDDPRTHAMYPHPAHRCRAGTRPAPIRPAHQSAYCLGTYRECKRHAAWAAAHPVEEASASLAALPRLSALAGWVATPAMAPGGEGAGGPAQPDDGLWADAYPGSVAAHATGAEEDGPAGWSWMPGWEARDPEGLANPDQDEPPATSASPPAPRDPGLEQSIGAGLPGVATSVVVPDPPRGRPAASPRSDAAGAGVAARAVHAIFRALLVVAVIVAGGYGLALLTSQLAQHGEHASPTGAALVTSSPGSLPAAAVGVASPSVSSEASPQARRPSQSPKPRAYPSSPIAPLVHVVVRGDTLTRIAAQYGVSVQALVALNHIPNPNLIVVGEGILIPNS